jgi:signal transduction histidine kinase
MNQNAQQSTESVNKERMSSQQLEAYFAPFPDAIVMWDQAGKILYLNTAALALFEVQASDTSVGISSQEFLRRYTWWDEQQRPFFFSPWLLNPTPLKEEVASRPYEQTLVLGLPSHRKVFLELHCSLLRDAELQVIGMLSVFHAVAPRYQKALHIQRVYEALASLNEAIARIPEQLHLTFSDETLLFSPPVVLVNQQLVDVIHQVLACWGVSLNAFRSSTLHVSYIVGSGFTPEQENLFREHSERFRFADVFDEKALAHLQANQEVIFSLDRLRLPAGYPAEFSTGNLLAIPLFWEQNLAGMLLVLKHGWESGYTKEEVELVRVVAAQSLLLIECLSYWQKYGWEQARELMLPETDRLGKDFLTLASHELRTPLTGIKGNLQLAQRRLARFKHDLDHQSESMSKHLEQTRRSLEAAEQSVRLQERMSEQLEQTRQSLEAAGRSVRLQERMVQDMIDDAHLQADQLDLLLKPCDLLVLIKQAVAKQQTFVPERTIKLEILTSEPTIPVLADAERIIQVLTIYLATALNSSPAERPVVVQVQEEGTVARISVHDEGPGISPEEQSRLWERFYRGKGSTVQHELDLSGGLRFYLCQALIERHHGNVGVQSTPGQGTTFWLTVPIARPAGSRV